MLLRRVWKLTSVPATLVRESRNSHRFYHSLALHVALPFARMDPFSFCPEGDISEDEGDDDFIADGVPMTENEVGVRQEGALFVTLMWTGSLHCSVSS